MDYRILILCIYIYEVIYCIFKSATSGMLAYFSEWRHHAKSQDFYKIRYQDIDTCHTERHAK